MDIIETGPEIPDINQLYLFDFDTQEADPVQNSTVSAEGNQSNETMIRSPTGEIVSLDSKLPHVKPLESRASSLRQKSRELVRKSKEQHIELLKQFP
jgi:hypothetical protein